jgi:small-conductance mechanosensitive channel
VWGFVWWRSWKVRQITIDAVSSIEELSQEDPVNVFFVAFGDSSVNLSVRMWINTPEQSVYKSGKWGYHPNQKKAYDANDIMIPFPIRTLDFG